MFEFEILFEKPKKIKFNLLKLPAVTMADHNHDSVLRQIGTGFVPSQPVFWISVGRCWGQNIISVFFILKKKNCIYINRHRAA